MNTFNDVGALGLGYRHAGKLTEHCMHHKLHDDLKLKPVSTSYTAKFPFGLELLAVYRKTLLDVYAAFLQMEPCTAEHAFGYIVEKGSLFIADVRFAASLEHVVGDKDMTSCLLPRRLPKRAL